MRPMVMTMTNRFRRQNSRWLHHRTHPRQHRREFGPKGATAGISVVVTRRNARQNDIGPYPDSTRPCTLDRGLPAAGAPRAEAA